MKEIFSGFTDDEEKAVQLALEFYGPIYLLYSLYDGAADKEAVTTLLNTHVERFSDSLKRDPEITGMVLEK